MSEEHQGARRYRIADAHTHIYKEKIARKASATIGGFYETDMAQGDAISDRLVAAGSQVGCERYLVCSAATTASQVASINRFIADECARHPEFLGLGTAHQDIADPDGLMEELIGLGLRGIKLHPDFQRVPIDDARMMPIYRAAEKAGLPILFHVGDERYDFSDPVRILAVLEACPDLRIQAAHFGCCRTWLRRPLPLKEAPVVFDTSSMLAWAGHDASLALIEELGVGRLMWGTDFPMWDHASELERFLDLGLTEAEDQAILYDNFAEFWRI